MPEAGVHPGQHHGGGTAEALLEKLSEYMVDRGHAPSTVQVYGTAARHFVHWLALRRTLLPSAGNEEVRIFVDQHLPRCRCPEAGPRTRNTVRAALRHLLSVTGGHAPVGSLRVQETTSIEAAIEEFDGYLRDTCGLTEATRVYRRRYAREFLTTTFGTGQVDPTRLNPLDIERFFSTRMGRRRPGSAQVIASSLRSYLRCQQLLGRCEPGLLEAVPHIHQWRLSGLPKFLNEAQLQRLLAAFDRTAPTGRRDYAMVRCLADLGLRAGEVARLRIDDVDWRAGTVQVTGNKSRRGVLLPVPGSVGRAIASYLRQGRPRTLERAIFVRHVVPVGAPLSPFAVRNALRNAAARAGFEEQWMGTHVLRHTAATRMLRGGATLKDIADVLGHRCLDTTAIYTKVDLPTLSSVAVPWPEEGRR